MVILYIFLALTLILAAVGFTLLNHTCFRHKVDDMWDEAQVIKHQYGALWDSIRSGRDWLKKQDMQPLQVMSFDGILLNGYFVPCEKSRGTVLMFHGWRSSWKLDFSSIVEFYNSLGMNIILVDERAHGKSEGLFITFGVRERHDVLTWVTYAAQLLGEDEPLFFEGVSMGAAAVLMSSNLDFPANVRGIIADSGFVSPYEIMKSVISKVAPLFLVAPALWLLNIMTSVFAGFSLKGYSTLCALSKCKYPVLFAHGTADSFVPYEMSKLGYEACISDKELILVDGADHALSYFVDPERVKTALTAFIDKHI